MTEPRGTLAGRDQLELLAGASFRRLWDRARAVLERNGHRSDGVTISIAAPTAEERHAVGGLLGRPRTATGTIRVRLADLDQALRSGPIGVGLVELLEMLGTPLRDRRAEVAGLERSMSEIITRALQSRHASETWFIAWLDGLKADGTLRRLIGAGSADLMRAACAVVDQLPADGVPLPVLASRVTGSTKSLSTGPLSTLVLRALAGRAGVPRAGRAAEKRALWDLFGVVADDLSSDVLVLNIPTIGQSRLDQWLGGAAADGTPMRLTLHQLSIYGVAVRPTRVWICENPAVMRAAVAALGRACAPVVCTEGRPTTAFARFLDALVHAGCELVYHGDMDWTGLAIAAGVMARHGARPWRMAPDDYEEGINGLSAEDRVPLSGEPFTAPWDPELTARMSARGQVLYEEQVIERLVSDLAGSRAELAR